MNPITITGLNGVVINGTSYNSFEEASAMVKGTPLAGELDVAILTYEGALLQKLHQNDEQSRQTAVRIQAMELEITSLRGRLTAAQQAAALAEM